MHRPCGLVVTWPAETEQVYKTWVPALGRVNENEYVFHASAAWVQAGQTQVLMLVQQVPLDHKQRTCTHDSKCSWQYHGRSWLIWQRPAL